MKVSIIVPVYNEKKTVRQILSRVFSAKLPASMTREVIVVNDASTDGTDKQLAKIKRRFKLLTHRQNQGKGAAILAGLSKSTGELILIQDADLEYDPTDYVRLLKPFKNKNTRVVYGSRLINYPLRLFGENKTPMPIHLVANKFLTLFTNVLYGHCVTDMETGYKVFHKNLLASLNITAVGFDFEPEVTAKLLKRRVTIHEVPIKVKPRSYAQGKKIGWRDGLIAIWTLVKYRFVD